jgi:prepilin-type N-terminal cleavage/methylation domain-containing protein
VNTMSKMVRGSKGYSLLEVVIAMAMLSFVMLASMQMLAIQYNNRLVAVTNQHFLNVADTIGTYLAASNDAVGNPYEYALSWGRLGLVDAIGGSSGYAAGSFGSGQGDLRVLEVTVDNTGWTAPTGATKTEQNNAYAASFGGPMVFVMGGGGKTTTITRGAQSGEDIEDGTADGAITSTVSKDIAYKVYIFKEINTEVTPKVTHYRIRIEPSDAMVANLGPVSSLLGVEVTYQQIRTEP